MRTVRVIFERQGENLVYEEVETDSGESTRIGKWINLPDDLHALQVKILNPISTINIVQGPDGEFVAIEDVRGNVVEAGEWFDHERTRELLLRLPGGEVDCQTEIDTASSSVLVLDNPTVEDDDDDEEEPENFLCSLCGSTYGEPTDDGVLWRCTDCGTRERPTKKKHHTRPRHVVTVRHICLCRKCGLFHWSDEECPDWPRRNDNAWYLCKFCEAYHPHKMNCIDGTRSPMTRLRVDVPPLPSHLIPEVHTEPIKYQGDSDE